jgi:hypothetical protein
MSFRTYTLFTLGLFNNIFVEAQNIVQIMSRKNLQDNRNIGISHQNEKSIKR